MNEISNPLDYLIQCCEIAITTGKWKLNKFTILNAKDELQRLRQLKTELAQDVFYANQNSVEDNNRWLSCEKELVSLKEKINLIFSKPVAYGLINDRHDLYNLTLHYNRFLDKDDKLIPLYSNREEFLNKDWNNGKSTK
jgi:hypothetical protein